MDRWFRVHRRLCILLLVAPVLAALGLSSCGSPDPDVEVLFVGNSHTHVNDVPATVEAIGDANGTRIATTMIAPGGARLSEHRLSGEVLEAIRSGDFDVVVFQEQSQLPSVAALAAEQTLPAARALDALADDAGVRVVWFQTWAHRDGWPDGGHGTYASMQDQVIATYTQIGAETGGDVAAVGQRWSRVVAAGGIDLYAADGVHASPAGSYLAALAITDALLVGVPLVDAPAVGAVDAELAVRLLSS